MIQNKRQWQEADMAVKITGIDEHSLAKRHGIKQGDILLFINGEEINDMLDLQFYSAEAHLRLTLRRLHRQFDAIIDKKNQYEPLGFEFETYLIDKHHSCKNKCIFCFVDQLPKGLRSSLYFKDDDERLSFLFGNYITLTNLSRHEIDRIKKMKISPINISVHTTDPDRRVFMMKNPRAAQINELMQEFYDAQITMNTQIVLCKGVNDGEYLKQSIERMQQLYPQVQSCSVVPIGVTKYREGLAEVETFDKEESANVIKMVNLWTDLFYKEHGERLIYLSDEFYLRAGIEIPPAEYYGSFAQIENGVGMVRSFIDNFKEELSLAKEPTMDITGDLAVGMAMYPVMCQLIKQANEKLGGRVKIAVHGIENDFFGGNVWVTGLLTAKDLIEQLKGKLTSNKLYLCEDMLRSEKDMFLDDLLPQEVEEVLNVNIEFHQNDGQTLAKKLFGTNS
ncbi:MAG: DUF512 domain-containing protein [Oscillospiraceae bacterium]